MLKQAHNTVVIINNKPAPIQKFRTSFTEVIALWIFLGGREGGYSKFHPVLEQVNSVVIGDTSFLASVQQSNRSRKETALLGDGIRRERECFLQVA